MFKIHTLDKAWRLAAAAGLAGAAAAAALTLTPGTFGGFTSSASNAGNSVKAGTVSIGDTVTGALTLSGSGVYTATNLEPGKSVSGTVTISNSGSLPETLTLKLANTSSGFTAGDLLVTVKDGDNNTIFNGYDLASGDSSAVALPDGAGGTPATWAAGGSAHPETYTVTVALIPGAGNEDQGASASFDLAWAGAQA